MPSRISWVIPGAVIAVGVFAGLDAIRSSGDEPPTASTEALTTTQTEGDGELELSAELQRGRVVKLTPGRVTVNQFVEMAVAFTVPDGWYGYQGPRVLGSQPGSARGEPRLRRHRCQRS
jgi:hypothetical protein